MVSQILRQNVHQRLMHVLDNAVIRCAHVQIHIGQARAATAVEPRQRNRADAVVARPADRSNDILRISGGADRDQHVTGLRQRAELVDEDLRIGDVVGDCRDQFDRRFAKLRGGPGGTPSNNRPRARKHSRETTLGGLLNKRSAL